MDNVGALTSIVQLTIQSSMCKQRYAMMFNRTLHCINGTA